MTSAGIDRARVRQIEPQPETRIVSTIGRVDYEDAFVVDVEAPGARSAEQWFRMILEGAPIGVRLQLLWGWSMIGLKVSYTRSSDSVLGWQIRASGDDYVLLGAESRIGMPGELLLRREERGFMFATFVRLGNSAARALWATVEPGHVRTVRALLEDAGQRAVGYIG